MSVNRLLENTQLSIILDYFNPAEIALIYLSPNFCPFKFIILASPSVLTKPIQHGKIF